MTTIHRAGLRMPTRGAYVIDPGRSVVRIRTRAIFGLLPVSGTVQVTFGRIVVADPPEASLAEAELAAQSFDTGNEERDNHVRSADFLDTATYPNIGFRSERVQISGGQAVVRGLLTLREVTRPVDLRLTAVDERDGRLVVRATTRVDRYAFGVTRAKGMTGRRITVTIEVVATR